MTPYEVLGISPSATDEEILVAYRRACMKTHPDRGGSPEDFRNVQAAFERLQKRPCPECAGRGKVTIRQGIFVTDRPCPRCWKI